jgi:signal transduction histidine kinase/ligand-binding sensor domain-containing protein
LSSSRTSREIRRGLLLCACAALGAQALCALDPQRTIGQYLTTRWSARDSFPGGAINAIAQTPDGFLWIGAENGLVRFDGISFRLLEHDNTPSLPAGHVLGLAVDSEGLLWVRMESPYLLRYRGGSFEQMYPVSLERDGVTAVARGTSGDVLIAPPTGPLRYSAGKLARVVASGAAGGLPMSIAETADGAVWVGMRDTGLLCVRAGRGSLVSGLPDKKVNVLLPGTGPELWIGTDTGLVRWDGNAVSHRGVPAALAHSSILALARDRDSNLWISTPAGIMRMDSNGALEGTGTSQGTGTGLPGAAHAIFEDREGNLWFGGAEGLMQLRDAPFLSYTEAGEGGSLYADAAGRAWTGPSSGGLIWIRGAEHHAIEGLGLDRDVIYSISGGPGELWVGRRHGGLTQLREDGGVLQPRTFTAGDGLAPGVVYAVYRGRDGTVWAGTLSGAVSRIQKGRITTFTSANGLSADAVTTIEETADGTIWVGTAGGLEAFRNGNWRRYGGDEGLPPGRVNSLTLDREGVLWIGSSSGVFYWAGSRFESARNTPDSLHGEIYGLAADDVGNLWAATERRVVSLSRASLLGQLKTPAVLRQFGPADGLPSTRGIRRDRSVVKDPAGRIWFSLQGGLCVVNPSLPAALAPALVRVESVAVDDRPLDTRPAAHYRSNRQRVVFNFIGVSLAVPARVRYRYTLDGYDSDWSQPTESREAAYTNLPPAHYTFRVMASNSEGLWNGAAASVRLEVEPQLSETWWFRMIGLCIAAAAIFAGFRYRMARANAAMNLRFEERLGERTRIARELHDTLLQSFQGLMLRFQVVDDLLPPGKAKEQLEQSLERADQAIAEGRRAVHDLRASTVAGNDLAEALRAAADDLRGDGYTAFRLEVQGAARNLHPILRDEVFRIACEGLRNAFKHARAQQVEAEITYGGRLFRLRIRDDGAGIPAEILESGRSGHYGIRGMRERARQSGATLEIWSRAGTGTEIELRVPGSIAYSGSAGRSGWRLFRGKAG